MTQTMSGNDLLMGSGIKSAKFETVGTTIGGRIIREPAARQQTDFDSGEPKTFANGDPMMQIVVHVQTELRDPADPADDGVRGLYIRGKQMTDAVRDAVKLVHAPGLQVGGELYLTFTGTQPNSRGRGQDKKLYGARYVAATAQPVDPTAGLIAPTSPAPATYAAPVATGTPAGIDPGVWARLDATQRAAVLAASGTSSTPPF